MTTVPRGQAFYQELLDEEPKPVAVSLRATSPGFTEPDGIARHRYFDPEFHSLEVERIWGRAWQVACREEQIPEVGDSIVYDIADWSLIVVRTTAGEIRAFHNSCLHRGTQLRTKSGNVDGKGFRCPYHGMTWNLDGTLREIPSGWDFPHVDEGEFCLPEAKVGTWGGFVFVNVDPDAPPLEEYLGVLPEHFAEWPLEDRYLEAHIVRTMPCNWKVALEAFIEAYHNVAVHPQLLPTAADSMTEYDIFGPHISRMVTAVGISSDHLGKLEDVEIVRAMLGKKDAEVELEPGTTARHAIGKMIRASLQKRTGRDYSDVGDAEILDGVEYFVFPNFMPWAGYLTPFAYFFRPNGHDPDSCIIDIMVLQPLPEGQPRPKAARTRYIGEGESWTDAPELGVFGRVFNQDGATFRRVQRGLKASARPTTTLSSYQESRIRHFHATIDDYLGRD